MYSMFWKWLRAAERVFFEKLTGDFEGPEDFDPIAIYPIRTKMATLGSDSSGWDEKFHFNL